jgi:protein-tyrosine phosphatase
MTDRTIPLTGIHNLRDYGGYSTVHGPLKRGLLYRSGQHVDATDTDLDAFEALGVHTIVDLRGDSERAKHPCRRSAAFGSRVLLVEGETSEEGEGSPRLPVLTQQQAHDAMIALYRVMPFRPNLSSIFRLYFNELAEGVQPSLVHCLAGKDRTGLAVALLHSLCGVSEDDIMADFLLTNSAGNSAARIAAGAETVRRNFGAEMEDEAVATLMSVHADYLNTAFTEIRAQFGSVPVYLEAHLDVTPNKSEMIKANLIS